MDTRALTLVALVTLSACAQEEPARPQEKAVGGQIGNSYKGMLDSARQGAANASDQMKRSDRYRQ